MPKLTRILMLVALASVPAAAEPAIPDLRGTWTGQSETIIRGRGNPHHGGESSAEPRLSSVPFTLIVDKQDGRRFSGTFSSPRSKEAVVAVISRTGTIYLMDDDGYTIGTMLAPNRIELCYMQQSPDLHIASCAELTKQP
jgi:hypothetical protein